MNTRKLNTGASIPALGFGLWENTDREQCLESIKTALATGYTHFDTAQAYGNEAYLGAAIADIMREDVFITTKIQTTHFDPETLKSSFDDSLRHLKTDYVDLLLLHFPVTGQRQAAWRAMEELSDAGTAKAIGVSNYTVAHLEELLGDCDIVPAVNQVELHVYLQQPELLKYCADKGIIVEAYSPLAHGHGLDNPVLAELAATHQVTPAQIMIRWCLQVGTVPLPKSQTPERIKSNFDVFGFDLSAEDMSKLTALDENLRTCWDPTGVE